MILILMLIFVTVLYLFTRKNHDYWAVRQVKHEKPIPFFGNHLPHYMGSLSITEIFTKFYRNYPEEKVVGYYRGRTPELIVRDLDIVRDILNVDFSHFHHRGVGRDPKHEFLLSNLFHVDGDTWKLLRQHLTSTFTTTKLKNMFPLIVKCAEKLYDVGDEIVERGGECDVRELMARFTTEFIGACGLGIEMDTINNEKSLFRDLGKQMFTNSKKNTFLSILWELVPELRGKLLAGKKDFEETLKNIVSQIRKQRNYRPIGRNDFIDLLLNLESKGAIKGESIEKRNPDGTPVPVEMEMTFELMVAQVFIFFAAGFETSSSATSYTLHELAYHPEIQEKIQAEIDVVLSKHGGLSFDAVSEMTHLEMAFKESMRLFPSLGVLNRVCVMPYKIEKLGITITPGVKIVIPVQGIQTDEKYFDKPLEFRPERFVAEEINKRSKYTYMPFGEGPRACIGLRLGTMQSMAGLAAILHRFSVVPSAASRRQVEANHTSKIVQGVIGGIPLKLVRRSTKAL